MSSEHYRGLTLAILMLSPSDVHVLVLPIETAATGFLPAAALAGVVRKAPTLGLCTLHPMLKAHTTFSLHSRFGPGCNMSTVASMVAQIYEHLVHASLSRGEASFYHSHSCSLV